MPRSGNYQSYVSGLATRHSKLAAGQLPWLVAAACRAAPQVGHVVVAASLLSHPNADITMQQPIMEIEDM